MQTPVGGPRSARGAHPAASYSVAVSSSPFVARLLVVQGDASIRELTLDRPRVLGRGEGSDLVLFDSAASRRHVQIEPEGTRVVLRDLGSTNGTFVNGRRTQSVALQDGDEVAIGGIRLRFRASTPGATFVVGSGGQGGSSARPQPAVPPIGSSIQFLKARALAERAAQSTLPVLLRGETGTGKEVFAHFIHSRSARAAAPFVALHAAAISPGLFEGELFGHERGAFTGADRGREGLIARAGGGTLFLDEVGELPLESQVKLLRVLESGEFRPVGGAAARRSDFRLVAATNRDLEAAVRTGQFRSDLLFRLNAFEIALPPLRDRLDDIPIFVTRWTAASGKRAGASFLEALRRRSWPGNVRELLHALERAMLLCEGEELSEEHLPLACATLAASTGETERPQPVSIEDAERAAIEAALTRTGGVRSAAARLLGISEPTLRKKVRLYGLDEPKS